MDEPKEKKKIILYKVSIRTNSNNSLANILTEDAINFHKLGLWVGESNRYNQRIDDKIPDIIQKLKKADITDAKIYRYPKLTLPREKVNVVNKKYGSRVVRNKEDANILVVSSKYLEGITSHLWSAPNYDSIENFKEWILCRNSKFEAKDIFSSEYLIRFIYSYLLFLMMKILE